ncbi:MAG: hypothetical protein QOD07_2418 [Frankiaceae bacterium]|jgi:hypothetical protein|nr:hypothetical protein [Frankiaceae bacterium]
MRRKTFDALLSTGGLVVAAVLIVAGALGLWAHSFANSNVHDQLAQQKVFFPSAAGIAAQNNAEITKYVTPYAGQQVVDGQQAEVFADHYIKVHLSGIAGGQTYSQVSSKFLAMKPTDPNYQQVAGQRQALFMGETLRGMLLNAYGFGKMGQIALTAAIVSFIGAGVMLLLSALGFWHLRRVSPEAEVLPNLGARTPAPVER